jgi:hypothetical protein
VVLQAALPERRHALILYFGEFDVVSNERVHERLVASGVDQIILSGSGGRARAIGGSGIALGLNAMSVYAVFIHPTSSTTPLILLFVPLYNLVIFTPLGIAAGRLHDRRRRSRELFSVPILALASWLVAEYFDLGPDKVGFTFLDAIAVAVAADLEAGILFELRRLIVQRRLIWRLGMNEANHL